MLAKFMVPILIYMIGIYGWRMVMVFLGVLSLVWAVLWLLTFKRKNERNIVKSESTIVSEKVKWSEIYPLFYLQLLSLLALLYSWLTGFSHGRLYGCRPILLKLCI